MLSNSATSSNTESGSSSVLKAATPGTENPVKGKKKSLMKLGEPNPNKGPQENRGWGGNHQSTKGGGGGSGYGGGRRGGWSSENKGWRRRGRGGPLQEEYGGGGVSSKRYVVGGGGNDITEQEEVSIEEAATQWTLTGAQAEKDINEEVRSQLEQAKNTTQQAQG